MTNEQKEIDKIGRDISDVREAIEDAKGAISRAKRELHELHDEYAAQIGAGMSHIHDGIKSCNSSVSFTLILTILNSCAIAWWIWKHSD